ncbi:hypothetical protein BJ912DRAFT_1056330 [Pholiota molesta]|nr:hypothetical protein BJ912DRAFT_1056330 [Pholiota molesta]
MHDINRHWWVSEHGRRPGSTADGQRAPWTASEPHGWRASERGGRAASTKPGQLARTAALSTTDGRTVGATDGEGGKGGSHGWGQERTSKCSSSLPPSARPAPAPPTVPYPSVATPPPPTASSALNETTRSPTCDLQPLPPPPTVPANRVPLNTLWITTGGDQ